MRVHLFQIDIAWEDRAATRERVGRLFDRTAMEPGDLVVLPEMFDSGFSFNLPRTCDDDGATRAFIVERAKSKRITIQAGITARGRDGKAYNRAIVAGPDGSILAEYDKVHLFPLGREKEPQKLSPGRSAQVFRWSTAGGALNVAPIICYDLRFPELFGQALGKGAEAFAIGANWPASRAEHWRALNIARAIENQAFVMAVNRVGKDPNLAYSGGSLLVDPHGRVIAEAGDEESVLSEDLDPREVERWRGEFPAWKERTAGLAG